MKHQIFPALLLSIVIALPGFTQTSPNSGAQPAATGAAAQTEDVPRLDPLLPPDTDFWEGKEPNLKNLITQPITTKGYVRRLTTPIQDRLNELNELTNANKSMIKDVDARAQRGIQLASERVTEADQHATDATNKAQAANLATDQLTTRVSSAEQSVGALSQFKEGAQTEIRFRPGESVLSKQAKDALDQMASPLRDQRGYVVEVRSYAPGRGQAAIASSQKMADAVVRYLVLNHQVPLFRIHVLSMGNPPVAQDSTTARRTGGGRVEISLLQNELVGSTQH